MKGRNTCRAEPIVIQLYLSGRKVILTEECRYRKQQLWQDILRRKQR
jgi:hypothetical protein